MSETKKSNQPQRLHHVEPWLPELMARLDEEGIQYWQAGSDIQHRPGDLPESHRWGKNFESIIRSVGIPEPEFSVPAQHVARAYAIVEEIAAASRKERQQRQEHRRRHRSCRECSSTNIDYLRAAPTSAFGKFIFALFHRSQVEILCRDCDEQWTEDA